MSKYFRYKHNNANHSIKQAIGGSELGYLNIMIFETPNVYKMFLLSMNRATGTLDWSGANTSFGDTLDRYTIESSMVLDTTNDEIYFGGMNVKRYPTPLGSGPQIGLYNKISEVKTWIVGSTNLPSEGNLVSDNTSIYYAGPAPCFQCHFSCKTCNGILETDCLTCHPWHLKNVVTLKCDFPCHASCATCNTPAIDQCVSCT